MNWNAVCGIFLAVVAIVAAILCISDLSVMLNGPSLLLTVGGTFFVLLFIDGGKGFKTHGIGGFAKWLVPSGGGDWTAADHHAAERFATSAGLLAILAGALGTLIGLVQMLQALEDPTAIGPALSVALLTILYAVVMNALFFVPMARHHRVAAGGSNASTSTLLDADNPLMLALVVLGTVGLCAGTSFLVLLLAMAGP